MDCQDHDYLHLLNISTDREIAPTSASLTFFDFKGGNQSNRLAELETSDEELSNEEFFRHYKAEEKLGKSAKWAVKETTSFPGMQDINAYGARGEEEQRISKLDSDLNEIVNVVECVARERLNAAKVGKTDDTRLPETLATLEVSEFGLQEGRARHQGEQEDHEHQQIPDKALEKPQMENCFLESASVESDRVKDCTELLRHEDLNQWQREGDGTRTNPRLYHKQLLLPFLGKDKSFQREIVTSLEESELKVEEQSVKIKELEISTTRLKEQIVYLEKRCTTAETKAGESTSLLYQLQTELDYTTTELSEAKFQNVQGDAMKLQLQEYEMALSHATKKGAMAESSVRELKLREDRIEEIEQCNEELEVRLKWRNEQFQLLEEAHSKLRLQLKEKDSEWDKEKCALFSDIDSLQSTLNSKENILREMQNELQMVHRALSSEQSRRKALELEAAESRQGLEQAEAGHEQVQTTLETLREQSSAEIGTLRSSLGTKDRQLKSLHIKHVHMEQEYNELKEMEKEYRTWQSDHGEQQRQLLSLKEKMSCAVVAHDKLRSRMKELEEDVEKEKSGLLTALDQAYDHLSSKDGILKQLDSDLDRAEGTVEHAQGHCSYLDIQLKRCRAQLERACEGAATARTALRSFAKNGNAGKVVPLASLYGTNTVINGLEFQIHNMDPMLTELSMHEEERLLMQRDYEELQQRQIQGDAERKELGNDQNSLLPRVPQHENAWLADREDHFVESKVTHERAYEGKVRLNEILYKNEGNPDVIYKLEEQCAFHDKEMAQHCILADQAREQLALERTKVENERRETRSLNPSLSDTLINKDLTIEKRVLKAEFRRKDAEISQNERVSNIEQDLKETSEVLFCTEKHIAAMKSEGCKTTTQLNFCDDVTMNLKEELRYCQEDNRATKTDLEGKLEVARRDLPILSMQLKAADQQLLEGGPQKEFVLKDLASKKGCLAKLTIENRNLLIEKDSIEQVVHVLETKKVAFLQEVESSRTKLNQLCNQYKGAQSNLASSLDEVKDLPAMLQNVPLVDVQLLNAEEQNRNLERYLNAAKATAQDREEKLIASEWAVQQLALDVGKAKAALTEKDREEVLMRDELADVERQLRAKEGALIEMECYLEDALMSRETMQREVDRFRQRMEDLDRGAAEWKRKEQEMTTRLGIVGAALEEKRAALVVCELEIKRGNDQREVMSGAIDSIKLQLLGEQKTVSAQQKDMNRLCEDLERSKGETNSAYSLVKDLQGRLQQLEHSCAVRINQLQSSFSELKNDLSLAHHQLEEYQDTTMLLAKESARYKQKCEALFDLNTRKDSTLKDTEAQLLSVRASALEQSKMLEQRDQDLQQAKDHSQCQDERQVSLEDSLSRIQSQRCELQLENEKLLLELRILREQLDASSSEVALKSKEIQSLQIYLQQKLPKAPEGERQLLETILVDKLESSTQAIQEIETRLCAVQGSLHLAQEKVQVLQAILVDKESDPEMVTKKISAAEKRAKDIQEQLSKSQEVLIWAQSALFENSDIISLHLDAVNDVEVDVASWKEEAGSSFKEASSSTQEFDAVSLATKSEKKTLKMETLEGIQLELKANTVKPDVDSLAGTQRDFEECKEKSAVVGEKVLSEGARVKALEMDTTLKNLREALKNAEGAVSKYNVLVKALREELGTLRVVEVSESERLAREERRHSRQIQERADVNQQQVCDSQDAFEKYGHDLKGRNRQNSFDISSLSSLRGEWLEPRSRFAAAESELVSFKVHLKDADGKKLERHHQGLQVNEAAMRMEHDLTEERGNLQRIAILELDLNEEGTNAAESASLIDNLQAQVEELKRIADESATEADKVKQDVLFIKEVMMSMELSQIEDRRNIHLLNNVEDDLIKERMKVVESATLISNLKLRVEDWRTKANDAAKEGEAMNQELKLAQSTISILMLQLKTRQAIEWAMKELHSSMQVDMNVAREECLARKQKLQIFLHQLGQSQDSEKKLLENLQIEHNRLLIDLCNSGEFVCTFEIDACQKMPIQDPDNIDNIRAAKLGTGDDEISPKLYVEQLQISAENCTLERANKALEKELKIPSLHVEESERQRRELAAKLDAALSNVAAKNLIIKQLNDEIVDLSSPVKKLKQETMSLQNIQHGEVNQSLTDTIDLARGKDYHRQEISPGKWKAEVQKEVNNYLELCDSLVRENVKLEKHLDGLQRKNRGLQKQIEGLQMKSSSDIEHKTLDRVDCRPEQVLQGLPQKTNPNILEKAMLSLRGVFQGKVLGELDENAVPKSLDRGQICPGMVLGEIDENAVPKSLDRKVSPGMVLGESDDNSVSKRLNRCQTSQRPLVSPGGVM